MDDPIFFDDACIVAIQTIGGCGKDKALELQESGVPLIPVSLDTGAPGGFMRLMEREPPVDLRDPSVPEGWCNFWRQDDWSGTAYFYLDAPGGVLPPIASAATRAAGLSASADGGERADT
jgi:hypothetical protein